MSDFTLSQQLEMEKMKRLIPNMSREQLEEALLASLQREVSMVNHMKDIVKSNLPKLN